MPFQKGNQEARVNKGQPKVRVRQWDNIVGWLVGDGGYAFKEAINKLSNGEAISKPQKEFIQHYKDLLEFHQPKLARQDLTSGGEKIEPIQVIVQRFDPNTTTVQVPAKVVPATGTPSIRHGD